MTHHLLKKDLLISFVHSKHKEQQRTRMYVCSQQQGVSMQLCLLSLVGYAPAVQSGHTCLTDHQSMPEAYRIPPTSLHPNGTLFPIQCTTTDQDHKCTIVNRVPFGMHYRLKPHITIGILSLARKKYIF